MTIYNKKNLKKVKYLTVSLTSIIFSLNTQASDISRAVLEDLKDGAQAYIGAKRHICWLNAPKEKEHNTRKVKGKELHEFKVKNLGTTFYKEDAIFRAGQNSLNIKEQEFENDSNTVFEQQVSNLEDLIYEEGSVKKKGKSIQIPVEITLNGGVPPYGGGSVTTGVRGTLSQDKEEQRSYQKASHSQNKGAFRVNPKEVLEITDIKEEGTLLIPYISLYELIGDVRLCSKKKKNSLPLISHKKQYLNINEIVNNLEKENVYQVKNSTQYNIKVKKFLTKKPEFRDIYDKNEKKNLIYYKVKAYKYFQSNPDATKFYIYDDNNKKVYYLEGGYFESLTSHTKREIKNIS